MDSEEEAKDKTQDKWFQAFNERPDLNLNFTGIYLVAAAIRVLIKV